ncbi:MAG TPA: CBS domain-containing protein [Candidatus Ozemobacteraceae bacterium]|nr:CBS domain-containing protein [Candidatus Ozemobacteraceae bacterium]
MPTGRELEARFFLADLIGAEVRSPEGPTPGRIVDFTLLLGEKYPRLSHIVIESPSGERRLARRDQFSRFQPAALELGTAASQLPLLSDIPDSVLVRNIWDKQIVDTSDARVVRVNDLQIAEIKGDLRLLGVDVGFRGLLRRLGFERFLCPLIERFSGPLKNEIIGWDIVESVPTNFTHLKLAVPSEKIRELHPADLADILDDLSVQEGLSLLKGLDTETAAETLAEAEAETQAQIIAEMPSERASDILEEMEPDEAVDILQDLEEDKAAEILSHMDAEEANDVRELLKHPENTAGGLMSVGFATVFEEFTVEEAFKHLRLMAVDLEIIYYLYVVNKTDKLLGVVSIRDLLVANPASRVPEIMNDKLIFVTPDTPQEEVAALISKYDLLALPVLDEDGGMVGVVTVDDVIELLLDNMPRMWKRRALTS